MATNGRPKNLRQNEPPPPLQYPEVATNDPVPAAAASNAPAEANASQELGAQPPRLFFPTPLGVPKEYDVFCSHAWAEGARDCLTHVKVVNFARILMAKGVRVWVDEFEMTGNVDEKMAAGVEKSTFFLAFVTENYRRKVNSDNANDNCKKEFGHGKRQSSPDRMLAVVLDEASLNQQCWVGNFGITLGGHLHVKAVDPARYAQSADEVIRQLHLRGQIFSPPSAGSSPAIDLAAGGDPPSFPHELSSFIETAGLQN